MNEWRVCCRCQVSKLSTAFATGRDLCKWCVRDDCTTLGCYCGRRHQSYRTLAKCKWPRAEWIRGDGRYALLAHCRVLTVALHQTHESAEKSKQVIDTSACGGHCHNNHEIIDLDTQTTNSRRARSRT
jgi:hypothetical protein